MKTPSGLHEERMILLPAKSVTHMDRAFNEIPSLVLFSLSHLRGCIVSLFDLIFFFNFSFIRKAMLGFSERATSVFDVSHCSSIFSLVTYKLFKDVIQQGAGMGWGVWRFLFLVFSFFFSVTSPFYLVATNNQVQCATTISYFKVSIAR
jgi:hypothetical protein